jgi:hypothetical protein
MAVASEVMASLLYLINLRINVSTLGRHLESVTSLLVLGRPVGPYRARPTGRWHFPNLGSSAREVSLAFESCEREPGRRPFSVQHQKGHYGIGALRSAVVGVNFWCFCL